ncbi:PAC2 family protein [Corynebacterium zhongnanshanii]|nr:MULTISPECIES: PAC2 family protein [Corynebacterium]QNP91430.1 PAC2 family protein [Corynebacterium zhongnanshanii]
MSENMYDLEYPAPVVHGDQSDSPVPLIVALQGYADAGQAVVNVGTHLLQALDNQLVASFNLDQLVDYRSRRPGVTLDHNSIVDSDRMSLNLHVLKDDSGQPFLLLAGPEPDLKWEAFSDSVVQLARRLNVHRVVSLYSAPMTVPHTRPLIVSAHASDPALLKDFATWDSRMIIPGAASLETELKLARSGVETVGLTAHVPHYIAANDYPEATVKLLQAVSSTIDREFPLSALEGDQSRVQQQLENQMEDSPEIAQVVQALEGQYDAEVERRRRRRENNLLQPGEEIPTGDELGAEFEAFLADVADKDTEPGDD